MIPRRGQWAWCDLPVAAIAVAGAVALFGCGTDDRTPNWGTISPLIVQPNCATASCHSRATAIGGLDFSTRDRGWESLTALKVANGIPTKPAPARPLVTPFDPDHSRMVRMLRADGADRMPPDRPLAEGDIELIEQWILNGAVND